jgi:segregation and condensation protein B
MAPRAEPTLPDGAQVEPKPKSGRSRCSRDAATGSDEHPAASAESLAKAQGLAKEIAPRVEAILLSVDRAVARDRVAVALGLIPDDAHVGDEHVLRPPVDARARDEAMLAVDAAVVALNLAYEETGRSFRIAALAGGYRITTLPAFAPVIAAFHKQRLSSKLSRPAVETLAIIAYRQPITRAELESIRGVSCGEVLRGLMDRRLVTSKGRAEELGRPLLYGTTKQFLDQFGLATLADLPKPAELKLG